MTSSGRFSASLTTVASMAVRLWQTLMDSSLGLTDRASKQALKRWRVRTVPEGTSRIKRMDSTSVKDLMTARCSLWYVELESAKAGMMWLMTAAKTCWSR